MADVTMKRFDELEGYEGILLYASRALGVRSWGMNLLKLPPDWQGYPEHDHVKDGQEEAYIALAGRATLTVGDKSWALEPGTMVRVGPGEKRKIVPGPQGATILALGGTPGKVYEPPEWTRG